MSGGHYDDGYCYELKALRKLCIKVGLDYMGGENAAEATIVKNVRVAGGCFQDGEAAYYQVVPLSNFSNNQEEPEYTIPFDDVPIEVRSEADPYTVFTGMD